MRDDEPERTEVFRLEAISPDVVSDWLKQIYPKLSEVDRDRIADFSDGNFRVARALADTLRNGETLGRLKDRDLFDRIFEQRNAPNTGLLGAAQDMALLYSYDGEDTSSEGELATIARLSTSTAAKLFGATAELRRRGLVQSRGRWRAILPHAIANPLAAYALERIPPDDFDAFCAELPPRMLKSVSRRLGYLHDSPEATAVVSRWLRADGPLGDLLTRQQAFDILANIAPVAPEIVLTRLQAECDEPDGFAMASPGRPQRDQWVGLVKALAYEPEMFEPAAMLLARLLSAEPGLRDHGTAETTFSELFQLHLSGTRATPAQRRDFVARLAQSEDAGLRRCAMVALGGLLEASRFTSSSTFDFGARSRDWGWKPTINKEVWDWHDAAIALAVELAPRMPEARDLLGRELRNLWHFGACHDAIEAAAVELLASGPWIEGWLGLRAVRRYDSKGMPAKVAKRLESLIERLKPVDLVHQARAAVLGGVNGGYDMADGEVDDDDPMESWNKAAAYARDLGRAMAADTEALSIFLSEVLRRHDATRAADFAIGLAEGSESLKATWQELLVVFRAIEASERSPTVLGAFLRGVNGRDADFCDAILDAVVTDAELCRQLPYLQACLELNTVALARLRRAVALGTVEASDFFATANGLIGAAPPGDVADLLEDLAGLDEGVGRALDVLTMYFSQDRKEKRDHDPRLVALGRELLLSLDLTRQRIHRDYGLKLVVQVSLSGDAGREDARAFCRKVREAVEERVTSFRGLQHVVGALFQVQSDVALDEFLLPTPVRRNAFVLERAFGLADPLAGLDDGVLAAWAERDPVVRFPVLGGGLNLFLDRDNEDAGELSPVFLALLDRAPDKAAFLGTFWDRLHPRGWSGSLANVLLRRRARIKPLEDHASLEVREWVAAMDRELPSWIEGERARDRRAEESFE